MVSIESEDEERLPPASHRYAQSLLSPVSTAVDSSSSRPVGTAWRDGGLHGRSRDESQTHFYAGHFAPPQDDDQSDTSGSPSPQLATSTVASRPGLRLDSYLTPQPNGGIAATRGPALGTFTLRQAAGSRPSLQVRAYPAVTSADRHEIYGHGGCLDGVRRRGIRSYVLDMPRAIVLRRHYKTQPFPVGMWWPLATGAAATGCHIEYQKGVSGSKAGRAVSILCGSRAEEGTSHDYGDIILFSPSGSGTHDDPRRVLTCQGADLLDQAYEANGDIRVLRKAGGIWGPSRGVRYDGIYRIYCKRIVSNSLQGLYPQFELRRVSNQLPIPTDIPTARQLHYFKHYKSGHEVAVPPFNPAGRLTA